MQICTGLQRYILLCDLGGEQQGVRCPGNGVPQTRKMDILLFNTKAYYSFFNPGDCVFDLRIQAQN